MEKITTRQEMRERLEDVLSVEIMARNGYEQDMVNFRNDKIISAIGVIKRDEDKHISLLKELIAMLIS
jgi:rubrerythrin